MNPLTAKSACRETGLRKRQAIAPEDRVRLSDAWCERFCQWFLTLKTVPRVVGFYAATKTELDVFPALKSLAEICTPALPTILPGRKILSFHHYLPGEPLQKGEFGIREPLATKEALMPDLLIVPLLAFDRYGNRVGYGAGYYDATLATLRAAHPLIALGAAFAFQEEACLPRTDHDQPLDLILTERDVITPAS